MQRRRLDNQIGEVMYRTTMIHTCMCTKKDTKLSSIFGRFSCVVCGTTGLEYTNNSDIIWMRSVRPSAYHVVAGANAKSKENKKSSREKANMATSKKT